MKRASTMTLGLLFPFVAFACSSEADSTGTTIDPPVSSAGTGVTAGAGTMTPSAGASTGGAPGAGGSPSGGAATAGAATGGGGAASGGTTTGGAGASTGGAGGQAGATTGGTATGGGGAATGGGGAATGGGGSGGTGGGSNAACPVKIDSKTACTQIIACPGATCGVFKLGAKNCDCAAASGNFTCTPCDYAGKTESIVQKPTEALPACTADDATLEATANCTSGDRCASMTANRFCACWTDPVKGSLVWDCDAIPKSWM